MFQALLSSDPACGVFLKHLANQVLRRISNGSPVCRVKSKWLLEHISENLLVVVSFERWVSAKEDEEHDTKGPDVAGLVIAALKHLRCDIVGSSYNCVHALDFFLLREALGETEINKFHLRLIGSVVH